MPADEGPGAGVREVRGIEGHYAAKTSSRASLASVPTPTSCFSSSSSSVSEIVGLGGQLRSNESLSSAESHSTSFRDAVVSSSGETCASSSVSAVQPELGHVENTQQVSPASPASQASLLIQEHSVPAISERNNGFSPVSMRRTSPDSTPTVTISRYVPPTNSVGWPRGSPTPSAASSVSSSVGQSSASPILGAMPLMASAVCTSLLSSSPVSSIPLSIPPVSLSPYLSRTRSPNTTRIVRSSPANQQPSPASRRSSPAFRITDASSTLDQLVGSSSRPSVGSRGEHGVARVPNLAIAHLASSDAVPPCIPSPPPTYDQLCNPNALPTYQEATQSSGSKRRGEHRTVFTLPSSADSTATDSLQTYVVQDGDRGLRGGVLASLAAELSDSEGGYSTILDAIPHEHPRDSCVSVPVRFLGSCSLHRLRPPKVQPPCLTSVCNKALVRKELNRRWPFIAGAREDDHCPGLILVECSSHLTVAHLPEPSRHQDGGVMGSLMSASGGDGNGILGDNFTDVMLGSPSLTTTTTTATVGGATTIDLDTTALTSQVLFYLCGKCVGYDSFDIDNVKAHIEYDCPGSYNQWGNNAELYLVLRAVLFVVIIIFVFVWLPYLRL
ncbi:uncharacterized protein [Procambarus clarkii]|uniref:uncharacterized protein isoform X2 n=1 Tax=Procambarus clarkii TaxID=6728 RepID=UPI001E677DA8|nr:uncharacterized protein LOC123745829 isoform X2 [Procambarus clarkii]